MEEGKHISGDMPSSSQVSVPSSTELQGAKSNSAPDGQAVTQPTTSPTVQSESLEQALAALKVIDGVPENMFRGIATIFQAVQMHDTGVSLTQPDGEDIWIILSRADAAEQEDRRDIAALGAVRSVLDQMLWARSQLLLPVAKIIADASRDASWRLPFGASGLLDFALTTIATENTPNDLQVQALRMIGNSCADTDENRNQVVSNNYLQVILTKMENPVFATIATTVLYNICQGYEPAQQRVIAAGLYPSLVRILEARTLESSPALSYLCQLLDIGLDGLDPLLSPENAVEVLLRAATQPDLDSGDCASLVDCAIAHLQAEQFQRRVVSHDLFGIPLRFLIRSYFPQANISGSRVPPIGSMVAVTRDPVDEAELTRVRKALVQALSDVSALPEFTTKHSSLSSPLIDSLVKWLSASLPQLQECSCIVLGNLARSDEICVAMVSRLSIHKDLVSTLRTNSDTAVIYSVLGFLRNLTLPKANKRPIGDTGAIEALARFLVSDSSAQISYAFGPQISYSAASLVRQLVNDTVPNIQRLLLPLSSDEESPASSKTYLSLLLALFQKSDDVTLKTEVARIVAAILRCIHSTDALLPPEKEILLHRLYTLHPDIGLPIGMMVTQSKYPIIRSEGWFAMALMARSSVGAAIIDSITSEVNVFTALEEAIRGTAGGYTPSDTPVTNPTTPMSVQSPGQPEEARTKDGTNALILVNEMLQKLDGNSMSDIRRSTLEDLLQDGARMGRS